MNALTSTSAFGKANKNRRLAWQVLQEIRHVLEILGDQRIPYEGERKRFRAEGDFLVRALVDLISHCRAYLGRLEGEFADLERLVGERDLPRRGASGRASSLAPARRD